MSANNGFDVAGYPELGHTVVGKTVYKVYAIRVGENAKAAGILGNYALVGPNGASYYVTDHGPKYQINSVAVGGSKSQRWTPAARPLRGLTRAHLSLFIENQEVR